jgi:acyl-CoA thioesterase I
MRWAEQAEWNAWVLFSLLVLGCSGDGNSPATSGSGSQNSRSNATVKIMPLGDSITESLSPHNSYRYYLWHLLLNKDYRIDFVGSLHGVGDGPPANPDFDMDHEGHPGWRADEILVNIQMWATQAAPDVVLLHIGTNDLCQGQSVASTITDIGHIIDVLRTVNPRIQILLAQLIGQASFVNCGIPGLNAQLPGLAADKNQPESPIVLVDQFTGFDPTTMTYDGEHPNDIGDSRMADRWFEKLAPTLDVFLSTAPAL